MTPLPRHVLVSIPVLLQGGTEIQTLSVVRVLTDAGCRVTVCCYFEHDPAVAEWFRQAGAQVLLMRLSRARGRASVGTLCTLVASLALLCRRLRPDVVHVQYLAPGMVPILAARLAGVRSIVATVHTAGAGNGTATSGHGMKAKALLRLAARLSTRFVCVSRSVEEFWFGKSQMLEPARGRVPGRHCTVYNAIDTAAVAAAAPGVDRQRQRSALGVSGRLVVGTVGRLAPEKGHTYLLDAMVDVIRELPEIHLLVVGGGPDSEALAEQARAQGLAQNTTWLGGVTQRRVFELLGAMDVFVMASLYEGFGLAAAEAMAAGLPVVATSVPGLCEVVEHGTTGWLVPPGDAKALSLAILRLLRDEDTRRFWGSRGRRRAEDLFGVDRFRAAMGHVYRTL